MRDLAANLPDRRGNAWFVRRLNDASRWFPPPVLWVAVAVIALAWRRPTRLVAIALPSAAAILVILVTALGLPTESHYSLPVAPAFFFSGLVALFGRRREPTDVRDVADSPELWRLAGAATGLVAALWALRIVLPHDSRRFRR